MSPVQATVLASSCLAAGSVTDQERVSSLTGNIQHIPAFQSQVLKNSRNITVYLPPDYETNKRRRYPVLYMNDGQNVFDGMTSYLPNKEWRADESAEALINAKLIEPLIIVAIDNGGMDRANEYLPTKVKFGDKDGGGKADLYGQMLITEILPLVNRTYRTKSGPEHTGLCGSSFGGIVTMYLGIKHPDSFGKLAVVSPSVWWDDRVILRKVEEIKQKPKQRIWLDIGTKEAGDDPHQNNKTVDNTSALSDLLIRRGWQPGKDLAYFIDKGAHHNEDAWAHRMPMILEFLFPVR